MYERHDSKFEDYLSFQRDVQSKRGRFTEGRQNRGYHIGLMVEQFLEAHKVLCIGARHPSEVEDLEAAGLEVIGIDLFSESEKIIVLDMHEIGEKFSENEFDVAYMSHSLEHSYKPEVVLGAVRKTCSMGVLVVLPMLAGPSRKETVVFEFMKQSDPVAENIKAEIEALGTGPVEVPWVRADPRLREMVFPLVWG